jgi:hypothetical protein
MSVKVCDLPVNLGPYFEEEESDAKERGVSFESSELGINVALGYLAISKVCAFDPLYA